MIRVVCVHGMTKNDVKNRIRNCKDHREQERWICISSSMEGLRVPQIASILHRNKKTIREWIGLFNQYGPEGLKRGHPPGKEKWINDDQIEVLKKDFEKSPTEFGFNQGYWSSPIIRQHIYKLTGVRYSKTRACELMREWGFSVKRPRMKSIKADPEAQKEFMIQFPKIVKRLKKKPNP